MNSKQKHSRWTSGLLGLNETTWTGPVMTTSKVVFVFVSIDSFEGEGSRVDQGSVKVDVVEKHRCVGVHFQGSLMYDSKMMKMQFDDVFV